ncbi:MAG: CocE/NonD family hydrolase [bacterium]|nr:CocE/NonD family hydrolase [bacterium]
MTPTRPIEPMPGLDVTVERDVEATMRDGTVLRSDVYRPRTDADLPVLVIRSIYDKRSGTPTFGSAHPAWFAAQGYVVVSQDCRGRYASDGDFYPYLHEMADGYDSVEWAARLPGSDGQVGMMGFSYVGATQLLAAIAAPPSLASITPAFTASQYYDGWTYNGGAFALAFIGYWATLLALEIAQRAGDVAAYNQLAAGLGNAPAWYWSLPVADYPPLQVPYAPYFKDWVDHCTYDDYWRRWSIDEDYSRIDVPALHVAGWYDVFLTGTIKNFVGLSGSGRDERTRQSQKLVVGPWAHMPWTPVSRLGSEGPSTPEIDSWLVRWFDQTLKGRETGVLDSRVTAFTLDGGRRDFDAWPPPQVVPEDWFIHSQGRANSKFGDGTLDRTPPGDEPPDLYIHEPGVPIPSMGGHSCCFDTITPMGPANQHAAEVSRMILVYTSEPLAEDIELIGDVEVTLYAATTATDTDFTARLCVVDESGKSVNLQEGILRARYRESLASPKLLTPGKVYEFKIDLGPVGARVGAGSRLRLDIASSDFPQWDRNLNTGAKPLTEGPLGAVPATQTVLHNRAHPTRVSLPMMSSC